MAKGIGIRSPLRRSPTEGFFEQTHTSIEVAQSNLRNLLMTKKGERLMDKNFGLNPADRLFENRFDKDVYKDNVYSQTSKYLPYLVVDKISIQDFDDDNSLPANSVRIKLWFHLKDFEDIEDFLEIIFSG